MIRMFVKFETRVYQTLNNSWKTDFEGINNQWISLYVPIGTTSMPRSAQQCSGLRYNRGCGLLDCLNIEGRLIVVFENGCHHVRIL